MRFINFFSPIAFCFCFIGTSSFSQTNNRIKETEDAMLHATTFMVEHVSTNGGYVWYYTPDLSRRWGEMEAYPTMIWVQDAGTVSMGHLFLDAYHATGNEYYYEAAAKAASALIWGQSNEGGWNYMIDFAGDRSLKEWYNTIGKNGWRLEEFQHYYGNCTYDDDVTSDAARFILRMYLEKMDAKYKPTLDKAINFILKSQYSNGGWPQRYPLKYDFAKAGHPDYSSFYTFNDDVIWENVYFLIQCYETLGEERFLDPIYRGMNFYVISQTKNGGWAQQYNMEMRPAGARTYEPSALLPKTTFANAMLLLKFYEYTGDKKYLQKVPAAIQWLEKTSLPKSMTENGKYTHPTFVDPSSDKALFVHRKGSNVKYGYYYVDDSDKNLLKHYGGKTVVNITELKNEYNRISAFSPGDATKNSPLKPGRFIGKGTPQTFYILERESYPFLDSINWNVDEIVHSLDGQNRWLVKHVMISHPFIGDGKNKELTNAYCSTYVGDETDTSPYRDTSDQLYISTAAYIKNMTVLINYLQQSKANSNSKEKQ
ncbi:MAG TPA: pectate lyase [Flavisolibacter sp.]|jgi:PelA/Pel-15E family pectate lyase|nr:pectate lyase [Flavisolibacter sp.]